MSLPREITNGPSSVHPHRYFPVVSLGMSRPLQDIEKKKKISLWVPNKTVKDLRIYLICISQRPS